MEYLGCAFADGCQLRAVLVLRVFGRHGCGHSCGHDHYFYGDSSRVWNPFECPSEVNDVDCCWVGVMNVVEIWSGDAALNVRGSVSSELLAICFFYGPSEIWSDFSSSTVNSNFFYVTSIDASDDRWRDDFCLVLLCHPLTQSLNLFSNDTDASSGLLARSAHHRAPTMTMSSARSFVELFWVEIDFAMANV